MATKAHTVSSFYLGGFVSPQSEGNRKITPFVWMGDINTGEIKRRAPRKISIVRGFYDGPSTFKDSTASLEVDFANKIESGAFGHSDASRNRCWYRINTWSSVPLYLAHRSANI